MFISSKIGIKLELSKCFCLFVHSLNFTLNRTFSSPFAKRAITPTHRDMFVLINTNVVWVLATDFS